MFDSLSFTDGNEIVLPEYVNDRKNRLHRVHDLARNRLKITSDLMKLRFDLKPTPNIQGGPTENRPYTETWSLTTGMTPQMENIVSCSGRTT